MGRPSRATTASLALLAGASWWTRQHRTSIAVDQWQPPTLPRRLIGDLSVRLAGKDDPLVVLLHGLVASGDIFGAAFETLADDHTLVVPDLLGFGNSLDENRSSFDMGDHLDALDELLEQIEAGDRPLLIGAHSMGSAIAMAWAARLGPKVKRVVCWGAPVYSTGPAVETALADTGMMARLFAGNTRLAQLVCHANCNHRYLAGWLAAAASPSLPVAIARKASLHTWPAYHDAIEGVINTTAWPELARNLKKNGTTVELVWGEDDPIGDRELARSLAGAKIRIVPGANHHLPLGHPQLCIEQLLGPL